jgi:hypothetical protein
MSHFAIKTFASLSTSANACIIRFRECPSWSIAPRGANFSIVSFTGLIMPPSLRLRAKDKLRIYLYARDLCGIAATGKTLSWRGWFDFMLSQRTTRACLFSTLFCTSTSKCTIASGSSAYWWGLRSIAACILLRVQSRPVLVGHPKFSQPNNSYAALCCRVSPCNAIYLSAKVFPRCSQCCSSSRIVAPSCVIHWVVTGCCNSFSSQ